MSTATKHAPPRPAATDVAEPAGPEVIDLEAILRPRASHELHAGQLGVMVQISQSHLSAAMNNATHIKASDFLKWCEKNPHVQARADFIAHVRHCLGQRRLSTMLNRDVFLVGCQRNFERILQQGTHVGGPTAAQLAENKIRDRAKILIERVQQLRQLTAAGNELQKLAAKHPNLFDRSTDPPRLL